MLIAVVTQPSRLQAARPAAAMTGGCGHEYSEIPPAVSCSSVADGVPIAECDEETAPNNPLLDRETLTVEKREDDGSIRVAASAREGGFVTGFLPAYNSRRRKITKSTGDVCCHGLESEALVRGTITIEASSLYIPTGVCHAQGEFLIKVLRSNDCNGAGEDKERRNVTLDAWRRIDKQGNIHRRGRKTVRLNDGAPTVLVGNDWFGLNGYPDTCQAFDSVQFAKKDAGVDNLARVRYFGGAQAGDCLAEALDPQQTMTVKSIIKVTALQLLDTVENLGD
jgi:hypothetical protein